jgi:5-methylcytosine-specific restriction protein A
MCEAKGRVTAANVVDHIVDHRGDTKLFWDTSNWQPLCKPCHSEKTAAEGVGAARLG